MTIYYTLLYGEYTEAIIDFLMDGKYAMGRSIESIKMIGEYKDVIGIDSLEESEYIEQKCSKADSIEIVIEIESTRNVECITTYFDIDLYIDNFKNYSLDVIRKIRYIKISMLGMTAYIMSNEQIEKLLCSSYVVMLEAIFNNKHNTFEMARICTSGGSRNAINVEFK